jgi:ABC-type Zn uptake system ZnuABC Zn-binding protein ZnuA
MERKWNRALMLTLIMVLSSLAGCLDDDNSVDEPLPIDSIEDSNNTTTPVLFGNVMVSTYHVGELVSAVAGEHVTISYMSQDNIPVHDYEPTVEDLIRLQNSDLFFYHGLGLEPWVESTLSSLGDDAPPSFQTHAMSTGQIALDYESLLVSNLCEVMNDGPFEATTLGMMPEDHHEGHDDHNETDDHDDHNETDDHDDHNETDDHDDHEGHDGHVTVEKIISNSEACPADTNIHVFHMEEGEHVLEFESEHDETFNMVVLKMLGGHSHNHDHGDHGDEHDDEMCHNTETHMNYNSTEEDCEAAGHQWMGDDSHHDDHGDEMCHNTETHMNYNSTEEDCEAAGHHWLGHEEHNLPEIHAERVVHTFSFPEEMVCYDISTHTLNMTLTTESDCQAAGLIWTAANSGPSDDDHDDHNETDGHDDHGEEEHHEIGAVVIHIEAEGDYGFALPKDVELYVLMGEGGHDDHDDHSHDDHNETDDHDDHNETDDHDDHNETDDHEEEINTDDQDFKYDPHSWLDPLSFAAQVDVVLEKLISTFPNGTSNFTENANSYKAQLQTLDNNFVAAFGDSGTCSVGGHDKTIVANHNAYSYMSERYDIEIVTVHGLDPEGEPSPQDIVNVINHIKENNISVLFVEEYTNENAVNSIVEDTGISVQKLYTMEMAPNDTNDNYISMMNKNLNNLVNGIGC